MVSILLFLNFLGTGEFILIAFVFLLLFGPDKIPGIARMLGRGIRKVKDATDDIKKEIHASSQDVDELGSDVKSDMTDIQNIGDSVKRTVKKTFED